jgi:hypothetical protein
MACEDCSLGTLGSIEMCLSPTVCLSPFLVLIVGCGIVGLSASLFLSHHGIASLLVERHLGIRRFIYAPVASMRARWNCTASWALMRQRGPPEPNSLPAEEATRASSPVEVIEARPRQTSPRTFVSAKQRGGDVRFHPECSAFEQDETEVRSTLCGRTSGTSSLVHASYLLAGPAGPA